MPDNFLGEGCTRQLIYFAVLIILVTISYAIEGDWGKEQLMGQSPHAQAIRAYMEYVEDQGYEVSRLRWGDDDPGNRRWYLISYEVIDPVTQERFLYKWAVRFPWQFYQDYDPDWISLYPEGCKCEPRTDSAVAFEPYMDEYLPDWYTELLADPDEE